MKGKAKGNQLVYAALRSLDECPSIRKIDSVENLSVECHVEQQIIYRTWIALVGFTFHYNQGISHQGTEYNNEIFFVQVSALVMDADDLMRFIATRLRTLNIVPKDVPIYGIYGSSSLKNLPFTGLDRCNLDFVKYMNATVF
jgi:hypothetical protein